MLLLGTEEIHILHRQETKQEGLLLGRRFGPSRIACDAQLLQQQGETHSSPIREWSTERTAEETEGPSEGSEVGVDLEVAGLAVEMEEEEMEEEEMAEE